MNILLHPTFYIRNLKEAKKIKVLAEKSKKKVNLIYSYQHSIWQGSVLIKQIEGEIESRFINFIIECPKNQNRLISYLEAGIKKYTSNFFEKNKIKLIELIEISDGFFFSKEKFKKIYFIEGEDLSDIYKLFELQS